MRRFLIIVILIFMSGSSSGCQYFGASIQRFSSEVHPDKYTGPVHAVAGDTPEDGWASLQENFDLSNGPVVLADFEHNAYLEDGVWDLADYAYYRNMVKYAPTGGQCMVILLGWRADGAHEQLINARQGILDIASTRVSPIVVIDWKPTVEAHPEYFNPGDPIHPATSEALEAYADLIASGVNQCP